MADEAALRRQMEVDVCRADRSWHIERHLWIKNKSGKLLRLSPLKRAQVKLLNTLRYLRAQNKPVRLAVLKSRKVGASTLIEADMFLDVIENQYDAIVIAHDKPTAKFVFAMCARYYDNYDLDKPEQRLASTYEMKFKDHEGFIEVHTANQYRSTAGRTPQYIHCSESAWWERGVDASISLMQTVADLPGTTVIHETTANGQDPLFFPLWEGAYLNSRLSFDSALKPTFKITDPDKWNGYVPFFISVMDDEDCTKEFEEADERIRFEQTLTDYEQALRKVHAAPLEYLNWRRATIKNKCGGDLNVFNQEYPETPEQAFVLSGRPRLNRSVLAAMPVEKDPAVGRLTVEEYWDKRVVFTPDPAEDLTVFTQPVQNHRYVIGVDIAEGKEAEGVLDEEKKGDASVAIVLDISTTPWQQVATLAGQISEEQLVEPLAMLGRWYNTAFIVIETNNTGKHVSISIPKHPHNYPVAKLYHKDDWNEDKRRMQREIGWRTHVGSKPIMVGWLAEAIEEKAVVLRDERTVRECMRFVKKGAKVQGAAGSHDDHPMALALAIVGARCSPRFEPLQLVGMPKRPELHTAAKGGTKNVHTGY